MIGAQALFTSCIERIVFEPTTGESRYVIDGFISDNLETYTITVFRTSPLEVEQYFPVENAIVSIIVNETDEILLDGGSEGEYCTPAIQATDNNSYQLKVLVDGLEFLSTPQALSSSKPDKDLGLSVRQFQRSFQTSSGYEKLEKGVMFSTEILKSDRETFYQWVVTEHYIIDAELIEHYEGNKYCYSTYYPTRTMLILEDIPVTGVTSYTHDLTYRKFDRAFKVDFCLEVERLVLNLEAYQYYNLIKKQGGSAGGLFDPTSFTIAGNMRSAEKDIDVLGFFGVHRREIDRIFINDDELPYRLESNTRCFGPFARMDGPDLYCYDCLEAKGPFKTNTITKPEWWR